MHLSIKLHGILRDYRPAGTKEKLVELDLEEEVTVAALAERLGIPKNALYLAVLNDRPVTMESRLGEGGFLRLFPPASGG